MLVITDSQWTLPNGDNFTIEIGNLALGAPNMNQSWVHYGKVFNSSSVSSLAYLQGQTPSNSFGMNIDSVAMSIPPSIYLGGYGQRRVLGKATVQNYNTHYFPVHLLDIGIGVVAGDSPFNFDSKNGLLAQGNFQLEARCK